MKRTKKIWISFLLVITAIFSVLGFAGCKENDEPKGSQRLEYELNFFGDAYSVAGIGRCTDTEIVIPREYKDLPVEEISSSAFKDCTDIISVVIPDSIKKIGYAAFSGCTGLTNIIIPDSVTSIRSYAFSGCTSLINFTVPDSVTSIESSAFSNCTSLQSITIPDSVTSIESSTFSNCTSLTSITIPDSVISIQVSTFLVVLA